jgi:uncharacterized protein (UPF0276 family)
MFRIATPVSQLFDNSTAALEIISESDCLECRDASVSAAFSAQVVFHCDIQPIHELSKEDFFYLEKIAEAKMDLKLVSFHAASSCNKPYIDGYMFRPEGTRYSRGQMLRSARANFLRIKAIFGREIKIALENNNYYPTEAYQFVTDTEFIREIVYENDISFLFDVAHARITAHNKKLVYEDYRNRLPLDKMVQIHLCRFSVDENGLAYDAHTPPGEEEWQEVRSLIPAYPGVEYLTIEFYRDKNKLIKSLKKAKEIKNELP